MHTIPPYGGDTARHPEQTGARALETAHASAWRHTMRTTQLGAGAPSAKTRRGRAHPPGLRAGENRVQRRSASPRTSLLQLTGPRACASRACSPPVESLPQQAVGPAGPPRPQNTYPAKQHLLGAPASLHRSNPSHSSRRNGCGASVTSAGSRLRRQTSFWWACTPAHTSAAPC